MLRAFLIRRAVYICWGGIIDIKVVFLGGGVMRLIETNSLYVRVKDITTFVGNEKKPNQVKDYKDEGECQLEAVQNLPTSNLVCSNEYEL